MIVYRIDREKRRHQLLSGAGAEHAGGRWNKVGTKAVYTAEHISLAYLEVVMHLDITEDLPSDRILAHVKIPKGVNITPVKKLPKNWDSFPYFHETQEVFTKFCHENRGAVLKVPSAVVPQENILILNPLHPDFQKIRVIKVTPFQFDSRMENNEP